MRLQEAEGISNIIRSIGKPEFGANVDSYLRRNIPFDMSCIFAFRFDKEPLLFHDGYSVSISRKALDAYLRGGYLLDPFYVACTNGHVPGLWRMSELAPDSFFSSDFIIDKDVHPCVSSEAGTLVEEIGFIVHLSDRVAATYSLMRNQGRSSFSDAEIRSLQLQEPIINAAISAHWRQIAPAMQSGEDSDKGGMETAFLDIFQNRLTPTQRMVAKLILRGHSNVSIARIMRISEGTAKIHRSNIYRRLSISSQSELFKLFIDYLARD